MALSEKDLSQIEVLLGRVPSDVEYHIFDTMWSEHCSYKSSKPLLKQFPTQGDDVALGIGEDAGIVRLTTHNNKSYCIAVSHESHNHPSQILPIEGAATGVGGCVRDVYCMGADVIGVLNSLHFGDVTLNSNPIISEIAEKVVLGVADYGNPLGVPVLGGETLYHDSYNDNCLVNVAALGIVEEDHIIHSYTPENAKTEPYDVIIFGKSTDATGFGGASFSSATLDTEDDQSNVGAVQVHDPFLKRVLVEATKALLQLVYRQKVPIGFKDLGAGGISCAASEIAIGGGFGVVVNLDQVNVVMPNLPPEVVACSETQERFCLTVPRSFTPQVLTLFNETFELPKLYPHAGAAVIGEITEAQQFIMTHQGNIVCDLPIKVITTEVSANREMESRAIVKSVETDYQDMYSVSQLKAYCIDILKAFNNRSKRYVYTHFDNAVRGDTVVYPGEADAVVVAPIESSTVGVGVSMDSNLYGEIDPYISGCYAVAESVRNVVSVGAYPIALTDCLNYGNPEKPSVFFDFDQGIKGISDAANGLSFSDTSPIPIISGNVSFYNESKSGNAIVPSPVIMCVGKVENYFHALTMQLKAPGLQLILIGGRHPEFGGTQFKVDSVHQKVAPQVRIQEETMQNQLVYSLILKRLLAHVHDIAMGGLWQTLAEMVLGENGMANVGVSIDLSAFLSVETTLFSENGGYVIAVDKSHLNAVREVLDQYGVVGHDIGYSTDSKEISLTYSHGEFVIDVDALQTAWATGSR